MDRVKITELIDKVGKKWSVVGAQSSGDVADYERKANIKFPEEYKWFLETYGAGGVGGLEILGIDPGNYSNVLNALESYKKCGLLDDLIPVFDVGEYVYCIHWINKELTSYDIVGWDVGSRTIHSKYAGFYEFLYEQINRELGVIQEQE
jgi:hypothetical protein